MPQVLTTNAIIQCPHGFLGTSNPTNLDWSVNGGTVLLENDTGTLACLSYPPCGGYKLTSMGLNATEVEGRKVILVTDFIQTTTGLPLQKTESHSTYDDSMPASIAAGDPVPPASPEMGDFVEPIVVATPPAGAFTITTMMPATLPVTFVLSAQHPLKWVLTLINETLGQSVDLTNGGPSGLLVAPTGGSWSGGPLTVSATMTAAFMAGLTVGKHHLFMTGVSKRGLFGKADFILTVT